MSKLSKIRMYGNVNTTVTGKLLYLVLDKLANRNGEIIIPQRKICNALNISKSAVSRNLHRLENLGVLKIVPTYNSDGGRSANKYIIS